MLTKNWCGKGTEWINCLQMWLIFNQKTKGWEQPASMDINK